MLNSSLFFVTLTSFQDVKSSKIKFQLKKVKVLINFYFFFTDISKGDVTSGFKTFNSVLLHILVNIICESSL